MKPSCIFFFSFLHNFIIKKKKMQRTSGNFILACITDCDELHRPDPDLSESRANPKQFHLFWWIYLEQHCLTFQASCLNSMQPNQNQTPCKLWCYWKFFISFFACVQNRSLCSQHLIILGFWKNALDVIKYFNHFLKVNHNIYC